MSKSKEFVEGFKSALNLYCWVGNDKRLRVGMLNGGTLLTDAIESIENELEPEIIIPQIPTFSDEIIKGNRIKSK